MERRPLYDRVSTRAYNGTNHRRNQQKNPINGHVSSKLHVHFDHDLPLNPNQLNYKLPAYEYKPAFPTKLRQSKWTYDNGVMSLGETYDPNQPTISSRSSEIETPLNSRCMLPPRTMDPERRYVTYNIQQIIEENLIETFAKDKIGCKFLQDNFPSQGNLKDLMYLQLMSKPGTFLNLSRDVFANFFLQMIIEKADTDDRLRWIEHALLGHVRDLCLNRYSCRVIQKALELLPFELSSILLEELARSNCLQLAVDQNANHVIQKIMDVFAVDKWAFLIEQLVSDDDLFFQTIESKYGCRVVQLAVDILAKNAGALGEIDIFYQPSNTAANLLQRVIGIIMDYCERLTMNEYSNYVVQHILVTESLAFYRDKIIEQCLLRNLLSFSQEKFASHVVEKALQHASADLLYAMMEEIFDGYLPDPNTKKDCLDILIFHQYGNYIVQRMLIICLDWIDAIEKKKNKFFMNAQQYKSWAYRLENLIEMNAVRLRKYSSGKKILTTLQQFRKTHPRPCNA